jgi:alpha,alpha-trehalose phosphorylase
MSFIIEDNSLDNKDLLKNESIFNVANGYIGIRGNFEEGYPEGFETIRGTYINAFYEVNPIQYGEKLFGFPDSKQSIVNVIDSQTMNIYIDGERFSLFNGEVLSFKRAFDCREGFVLREIHWKSQKGFEFKIRIKRIASFTVPELFLTSCEIESVNYEGRIEIVSEVNGDVTNYACSEDPRVGSYNVDLLDDIKLYFEGDTSIVSARTKNSNLKTACCVRHYIDCPHSITFSMDEKRIRGCIILKIAAGSRVKIDKYAVYTDSLRHKNPAEDSLEICTEISKKPGNHYFELQKQYLDAFWQNSDVVIEGCESLETGIRYNIYQLLQSVGKDRISNICAKGLSGEGYEGHYF